MNRLVRQRNATSALDSSSWLTVPAGADLGLFLLSDGKLEQPVELVRTVRLAELFATYRAQFTAGAKEVITRAMEDIHMNHLARLIGGTTPVAYTGARRAELFRARVEDFDFDARLVLLREKKRSRDKEAFRTVDMTPGVEAVMREYFAGDHPGGELAFCSAANRTLTDGQTWKAPAR